MNLWRLFSNRFETAFGDKLTLISDFQKLTVFESLPLRQKISSFAKKASAREDVRNWICMVQGDRTKIAASEKLLHVAKR